MTIAIVVAIIIAMLIYSGIPWTIYKFITYSPEFQIHYYTLENEESIVKALGPLVLRYPNHEHKIVFHNGDNQVDILFPGDTLIIYPTGCAYRRTLETNQK